MITFNFDNKARTPLEQLQNYAKSSGFYDENVLSTISTNEQKINYLQMLSSSSMLALKERLGPDYNSISDPMTKYWQLENEYRIAIMEKALADETYLQQLSSNYDKTISDKLSADERISGNKAISSIVNNKYGGDYSTFVKEFKSSDEFFNDDYLAFAEEYDEDETRDTLDYMQGVVADIDENPELTRLYARRDALNQAIAADKLEQIKQKAYRDASFAEKFASSLVQIGAAPVTEFGNIMEGIIDACALVGTIFTNDAGDTAITEFISQDTIAWDTLLAESLPNSFITSPYADENPLKWIYNIETSIIDMAPMALSTLVPGLGTALGTALYYIGSAGRTAEGYILENPNASLGDIAAYTSAVTIIEAATERLNADAVFGKGFFGKYTKATDFSVRRMIVQGFGEGVEEIASEIGSQMVASFMTGENHIDVKQALIAGAYGAATGIIMETGSTAVMRRRIFGIGTRITNSIGNSVTLNIKDSMILEDFMAKSESKINDGIELSKRDQELYDKFKALNFSDEIVEHRQFENIKVNKRGEIVNADVRYMRDISDEAQQILKIPEVAETQTLYNQLADSVNLGEDYSEISEKLFPEDELARVQTETSTMAKVWANNLLAAADVNAQSVVTAAAEYYYGELERIVESVDYKYANAVTAKPLEQALDISAKIVAPNDKYSRAVFQSLRDNLREIYPGYTIEAYITDNKTSPIVSIVNDKIFINMKFVKNIGASAIVRAAEMQVLTERMYQQLDERTKDYLGELATKVFGVSWSPLRSEQIRKQLLYTALFNVNNDLSIQLSELDSAGYEKLRNILAERTKSEDVNVRNTAYRGMVIYDTTILKRMSADEATERQLLSGNYTIEELQSLAGGPDAKRLTSRYGIDASTAAVRLLSAVRHLSTNFGFSTDISNIYQVLRDIKNSKNYSNIEYLNQTLARYDGSFASTINRYLRDQFNFEIDMYGTIIATQDTERLLDYDKVDAFYTNEPGAYVALKDLLTDEGKATLLDNNVLVALVEALPNASGEYTSSTSGTALIKLVKETRDEYRDIAHELQHHLTYTAHLPAGISSVLSEEFIAKFANKLDNKNEFDSAVRTLLKEYYTEDELDVDSLAQNELYEELSEFLYLYVDVDEAYSNSQPRGRRLAIVTKTYLYTGKQINVITNLNIPKNSKMPEALTGVLKYFDGITEVFVAHDQTVAAEIGKIIGSTTTLDSIMNPSTDFTVEPSSELKSATDVFAKLKDFAFGDDKPTDADLCSPQYLASKVVDENLRNRILQWTPEQCKQQISRLTGMVFDEYAGKFVEFGKTAPLADYIKFRGNDAIIISKADTTIIQIPRDYAPGKYPEFDKAIRETKVSENMKYFVDDRMFANLREVATYTNNKYISAAQRLGKPENAMLAEFDKLIDNMPSNGFKQENDFAFVTNDGKVFSFNTEGKPGELLKTISKKLGVRFDLLSAGLTVDQTTGQYTGTLESGKLAQLFDAKKIVRAYFIDGAWQAYGKPNWHQDNLLRMLNTTSDKRGYILPQDSMYTKYIPNTAKLVVTEKGTVKIDRTGNSEYREVSWKNNAWYGAICQIIEKYDIRKISEFKDLGFNEAFIDSMTKNYGRAVQGKTAGKLGLSEQVVEATHRYSGMEQNAITEFINDNSASIFARNLLIQNAPERVTTDNLNWQNSAHIRSVEDATNYLKAILAYSGTLRRTNNTKKYSSLNELIADCKQAYLEGDENKSMLVEELKNVNKTDAIEFTNIISEFLNLDARQSGKAGRSFSEQGLDYSLEGFGAAAGMIKRGFAKSTKSADSAVGSAVSIDASVQGRHADEESNVSVVDTDKSVLEKAEQLSPEAKVVGAEDRERIKWFERQVKKAKSFAKTEQQYAANLKKIKDILVRDNQRYIDEIDEPDKVLSSLIERIDKLMSNQIGENDFSGVDKLIADATNRIETAEDKRAQQDTEYQLITSKAQVLRKQYGDKGYQRLLEALGTKAIFGKAEGVSNINSNISKRLANAGSASINARIDKLIADPQANARLKGLTSILRNFKDYFAGIDSSTEGYTNMRFRYSGLLTDYYNFIQTLANTGNMSEFKNIQAEYKVIANYLDNIVLDGNFNFERVYPEYGAWVKWSEQLIDGTFEDAAFLAFNNLSLTDRIEMLKSWIDNAITENYPKIVIDRMQRILEDAQVPESPSFAKVIKPAINMSILTKTNDTNLSADATAALQSSINAVNAQVKATRETKHDAAVKNAAIKAATTATINSKYAVWSFDRLTREYRSYLNSPAITQEDAETLIMYAAEMIRNFDFQTKHDIWRAEAKKAWSEDDSTWVKRHKAFLHYAKKGAFPKAYAAEFSKLSKDTIKDNIAEAFDARREYIRSRVLAKSEYYNAKRRAGKHFTETKTTLLYKDDDEQSKSATMQASIKSVDDLLKMYADNNVLISQEIGEAEQYETIHKSIYDILEDVAKQEALQNRKPPELRKIIEDQKLNNIINGVSIAINEFQYRPMTLASAIKFIIDVRTVLQDRALNKSLFSWKNNVTVSKETHHSMLDSVSEYNSKFSYGSLKSFEALMDYLDSGKFVSHSIEIENELNKSADEVSGMINTYIDELKELTLSEDDLDLDSNLSQVMRYSTDRGDIDSITPDMFETDLDIPADDEITMDMFETEESTSMRLLGEDFDLSDLDFEMDESEDIDLSDEIIPPVEKSKTSKSETTEKPKKKTGDQRSVEEQFPGFNTDASRSTYKTVKSKLLTRNGVDLETALNYEFRKTKIVDVMGVTRDRTVVNTEEFISNPVVSEIMRELKNSEPAIRDFIEWFKEAKSISSEVQLKAMIILNKITAIPGLKFDILREARVLQSQAKSVSAAILGLGNKHGLTPVEEVNLLASELFKLTDKEIEEMSAISDKQDAAITAGNYTAADSAMTEALKIFEKHKDELDSNINPFTAETPEERAVRWKNLSNKITTWKYFAMLSSPATFWAKNYVGNYVAKGFNEVSSKLAAVIQQKVDKHHGGKYVRTNKPISESARAAVAKNLIANGLVDSILNNTVAKYDTGYKYRPNSLSNIAKDIKKGNELTADMIASLNQLVSEKTPFGDSKNPVSSVLNEFYGIIFNTMNETDSKFMRADIIRLTERLVSDNFTKAEIAELSGNTISEKTKTKFENMVDYARQQALVTYFRSTPKVYSTIMALFKDHPIAQTIFSVIAPFPRMVLNTTMTAIAYSPFGFINAVWTLKNDQSMFSNITASQQFAKATTGSVAMLIGAMLAALGALKIDDEDKYAGPQLVIFDTLRVSLEGLEPSATPFIVGSMLVLGPQTDAEVNAFSAAAEALLDTTILGELMSQFGQGKTGTEWVGDTFSSYVTQFIPSILRKATQVIDPAKKDYSGGFEMLKRVAGAVPGMSFLVPNKVDPYTGKTQVQYTDSNNAFVSRLMIISNAIMPTKISIATDSLVERESKAVGAATTGPAQTITVKGVEYKLSKKQYNEYKILRAKLYSKYASELINTDAYKKLSIEKKRAKLKQLQTKATEEARKQLNLP